MEEVFAFGVTLRQKFRSMWSTLFAHLCIRHYCHIPGWHQNLGGLCSVQIKGRKASNLQVLMASAGTLVIQAQAMGYEGGKVKAT